MLVEWFVSTHLYAQVAMQYTPVTMVIIKPVFSPGHLEGHEYGRCYETVEEAKAQCESIGTCVGINGHHDPEDGYLLLHHGSYEWEYEMEIYGRDWFYRDHHSKFYAICNAVWPLSSTSAYRLVLLSAEPQLIGVLEEEHLDDPYHHAVPMCSEKGQKLCTYDELCPGGQNGEAAFQPSAWQFTDLPKSFILANSAAREEIIAYLEQRCRK